jgi:hypothetical protein
LGEYVKEGVGELDQSKLTPLLELRYQAVSDAARELGGIPKFVRLSLAFKITCTPTRRGRGQAQETRRLATLAANSDAGKEIAGDTDLESARALKRAVGRF